MQLSLKTLVLNALLFAELGVAHTIQRRQDASTQNVTQYAPIPDSIDERQVGPEGYAVEHLGGGAYRMIALVTPPKAD